MTNTRITDPESLKRSIPLFCESSQSEKAVVAKVYIKAEMVLFEISSVEPL